MFEFLIIGIIFSILVSLGLILNKFHIPWIIFALFIGILLKLFSIDNITETETFKVFSNIGMMFLLFMIGFELDYEKIKSIGKKIFLSTIAIVVSEAFLVGLFIYYIFKIDFYTSLLVGFAFATIGEGLLLPILDKFNLIKKRSGQIVLSIGAIDDVIEVLVIIVVLSLLPSAQISQESTNPILYLVLMSVLSLILLKFAAKERQVLNALPVESMFIVLIGLAFVFIGIGEVVEAGSVGALLAGIIGRNFLTKGKLEFVEKELKSVVYGMFAPFFFISVGYQVDLQYFKVELLPIFIALILLTAIGVLMPVIAIFRKILTSKEISIVWAGSLVKFSTGLVVLQIMFDNKIINNDLFSLLVSANIFFAIAIPILFTIILKRIKPNEI